MGAVWRAHDESLDRDVAVKEIVWPPFSSEAEHETARRRASREARMAARLRHPNVVGIYDIVEEDDRPWIVMELLPYQSLRDIVREDGPLAPKRAAELGLGVLAALRSAHDEGVLHRDVKPGNILVGSDGRVVLTDFGIARAADSPTLTNSGMLAGSPSFIAPERALGGRGGPASDLWGLGASLYAMVEGRAPFEREGPLASLTAVVTDEAEPAVNAGLLEPVISGLLTKDPGQRLGPAEADLMLRQVVRGGGAALGEGRAPSRQRLAVLAIAAAVIVAAGTGTALALSSSSAPRAVSHLAAPRSAQPSPRSAPAGYGALPAGYYRFTNSTGFSIGVPSGWTISHAGHYVYVNDPSNPNVYLLIDQSDQPKQDPLADWEQQQANRESTYPDYHLIRLAAVDYPQAEKAADWEFTYDRDGVLVHILNRNVLANARHAYALYWSTPESDWNGDYHYFQAFAATFRPAPA
jgi:eukaryotic-like serine/threonine-protein kinase